MFRLLIADDEELVRRGLTALIQREAPALTIVGTAADGLEALQMAEQAKPDIVCTDIRMPGLDGLDLIERLHNVQPAPRTIILSGYDEFDYARRAIRLGVAEYLLKPVDPDQLLALLARLQEQITVAADRDSGATSRLLRSWEILPAQRERWPILPTTHRDALLAATAQGLEHDATREAHAFMAYARERLSPSATRALWIEMVVLLIDHVQQFGVRVDAILGAQHDPHAFLTGGGGAGDAGGLEAQLVLLVARAARACRALRQHHAPRGTIAELRAYIDDHLAQDLTINTLARRAHLNAKYLGELFKEATGEPLGEYIIRTRMRRACELLAHSPLKVYAVAEEVGYSSPKHFATMFRSIIGLSPAEYRERRRQTPGEEVAP